MHKVTVKTPTEHDDDKVAVVELELVAPPMGDAIVESGSFTYFFSGEPIPVAVYPTYNVVSVCKAD
jgi:hypothetical protein